MPCRRSGRVCGRIISRNLWLRFYKRRSPLVLSRWGSQEQRRLRLRFFVRSRCRESYRQRVRQLTNREQLKRHAGLSHLRSIVRNKRRLSSRRCRRSASHRRPRRFIVRSPGRSVPDRASLRNWSRRVSLSRSRYLNLYLGQWNHPLLPTFSFRVAFIIRSDRASPEWSIAASFRCRRNWRVAE